MNEAVIAIALCIHVVICALYFILIKLRIAHIPGSMLAVIMFVPVFGLLSALCVEWILHRKHDGFKMMDIEKLSLGESIYNKIVVDENEQPGTVIPLEEAILINDVHTRRAIMIDILHRDPKQYLELLKVARFNNDIEVTHYAATTIIEIQRDFELSIQQLSLQIKNHPQDIQALDQYIDVMDKYLKSGLLEGHLLHQQRLLYAMPLKRKIELCPDEKQAYFQMIENDVGLKNYVQAEETVRIMIKKWPGDENVWFAGIRVYVESKNSTQKAQLLEKMKSMPINWTAKGKERMRFWCGADPFIRTEQNVAESIGTT